MRYYRLTKKEEQIVKDFGESKLKTIKNLAEQKKTYQEFATGRH